jgi:uncharacterized membrane protein
VKGLKHIVRPAFFAAALTCLGTSAFAEPQIEISFESVPAESQKLVHAQAVFPTDQSTVYNIFEAITAYPMLHDWIRQTTQVVSADQDSEEFLVEFAFPWPVGRQWSRVAVRHDRNMILWQQLEGTLKANHGSISFTTANNKVHIDYLAAIDIGLPELWTQSYKEKFVREFLTAACAQAEAAASPRALALAAER